jgi:hypothetical protein
MCVLPIIEAARSEQLHKDVIPALFSNVDLHPICYELSDCGTSI